jgi:hypothetical protein
MVDTERAGLLFNNGKTGIMNKSSTDKAEVFAVEPRNRFQGMNSARLCCLAGRYDNTSPTRFLAPIDCLKVSSLGHYQNISREKTRNLYRFIFLFVHFIFRRNPVLYYNGRVFIAVHTALKVLFKMNLHSQPSK